LEGGPFEAKPSCVGLPKENKKIAAVDFFIILFKTAVKFGREKPHFSWITEIGPIETL
jgi:hypothetical protein